MGKVGRARRGSVKGGECKPPDRSPAPAQLERRTHGARSCRRSRGETGLSELKEKKKKDNNTTRQNDKQKNTHGAQR